jgi:hypothetical protein
MPVISYSWRSIIRGLIAVKEGMIWRVGDGGQINMWIDPRIREALLEGHSHHGITLFLQRFRVTGRLDPHTGGWDAELIHDLFWEEDVQTYLIYPNQARQGGYVLEDRVRAEPALSIGVIELSARTS